MFAGLVVALWCGAIVACSDDATDGSDTGLADAVDVSGADADSDAADAPVDVSADDAALPDADASPDTALADTGSLADPVANVGVSNLDWTYADDRRLPVTVWYPTDADEGAPVDYFRGLLPAEGVLGDAPVADGPHPLVVFSHGNQGFAAQSFFLTEHLASRGFVVVAADHVGNDVGTYDTELWVESALRRPRDVSALIDAADAWSNDAEHPLYQAIDVERVAVIGHSFGGYTTIATLGGEVDMLAIHARCAELGEDGWRDEWAFCDRITDSDLDEARACDPCALADRRIDVAVAMAPAFAEFFVAGSLAEIDTPTLFLAGTLDDPWSPEYVGAGYFDRIGGDAKSIWSIAGASHYSFSNACTIEILRNLPLFDCRDDVIDPERGFDIMREAVTAFVGVHLGTAPEWVAALEPDAFCRFDAVEVRDASGAVACP